MSKTPLVALVKSTLAGAAFHLVSRRSMAIAALLVACLAPATWGQEMGSTEAGGAPPTALGPAGLQVGVGDAREVATAGTPAEAIGSGDGEIHVIPSLSAPSVKNGGTLSIQAVIKAQRGIVRVEARIEREGAASEPPLATLALQPPTNLGGVDAAQTVGLWHVEWTASGLVEAAYRVVLTVTDSSGHSFADTSLRFSDPIAGRNTVGSASYPNGGMRRLDAATDLRNEVSLVSAVIDTANGYAYFGTYTSPGTVVKVALGSGSSAPTRVGSVTLAFGENQLRSAVIDAANGYAYFGTNTNPVRVVKVALGSGSSPPTRVGAVALNPHEDGVSCAVIDPTNGFAYFGLSRLVVKVALGSGSNPPTRVGAVTLESGEDSVTSAVIDAPNGHAYFGTGTSPSRVVKVALGSGSNPPTRVGAVTLESGEDSVTRAVIDVANGFAYFGTNTSPSRAVKVALGSGSNPPTRVGAVTLESGEEYVTSAVIDAANGFAYFGTGDLPGRVVKVALGSGSNPPTRIGALTLDATEGDLGSAVIDTTNGYAYFGTDTYVKPDHVVKVALGTGSDLPARVGALTLACGEIDLSSATIDVANGYAYFGTWTSPGRVVKVALGSGSTPPTRAGALTLENGEDDLYCAVVDAVNGFAYFGTFTNPGLVVKVALGSGSNPPTRVGALTLDPGEDSLSSAVIDAANGFAYFGAGADRVVKVALGSGSSLPTRVGAVTLDAGEQSLSAVIDTAHGYAYFGTIGSPARVVKVALGSGSSPPTRVGAVTLDSGENQLNSAVIDTANGFAYFATNANPGRVVKVALGDGPDPPTRVGAATLDGGEVPDRGAVIDGASGFAYFGMNSSGRVVKVALGSGPNPPTRIGAVTLATGEQLMSAVIDAANGFAYFGTWTHSWPAPPGDWIVRVGLSQQGFVKATKLTMPEAGRVTDLHFYSHAAAGNVRLALYDNAEAPNLLWQSGEIPNLAAEAWLPTPVSGGTPATLALAAGTYWLAWQVDTAKPVPSYATGSAGDGFFVPRAFGVFPAVLDPAAQAARTFTDEVWSAYLTYELQTVLTVARAGAGTGSVTSSPMGIDCGARCAASFLEDTVVTLTPTPSAGSTFKGWTGDCVGVGPCQVTMSQARSVTATFGLVTKEAFVVVHAPGANGTTWTSDVVLHDLDSGDVDCQLSLLVSGSPPLEYSLTLDDADGVRVIPDVVQTVFGLSSTVGGLEVQCDGKVGVGSRVRSTGGAAQTFLGLGSWGQLTAATPVRILGAAQNPASRTNLWLINLGAGVVAARVDVRNDAGTLLTVKTLSVTARSYTQVALSSWGLPDMENGTLDVTLSTGDGPVVCGANRVDNTSIDAATLTAMPAAGSTETLVMPAVRGTFSGAVLRTGLHIMNPGTSAAPVQVELSLADGATAVQSVSIPPGSSVLWSDAISSLFGLSAGTGVVRVTSTSPILAQARLWTAGGTGSYHEAIPGLPASLTGGTLLRGSTWPGLSSAEVQILATGQAAANGSVAFTPPTAPLAGSILSPFTLGAAGGTVERLGLPPLLDGISMGEQVVESSAPVQAFSLQVSTLTGDPLVVPLVVSAAPRPVIVVSAPAGVITLDAYPRWAGTTWSWSGDGAPVPGGTSEQLVATAGPTYHVVATNPLFAAAGRSRPVVTSFPLNVSRGGNGTGTVTSSPPGIDCGATCAAQFAYDSVVTLTAAAATGSAFTGWSGEGCSGTGTCQVTMDAARSVTATFTLNTYALTVARDGSGSGTVTSIPPGIDCGSTCAATFDYGTVVTLSQSASDGSTFAGWSGGCSGTGPCQVTMNQLQSVTATFTLLQQTDEAVLVAHASGINGSRWVSDLLLQNLDSGDAVCTLALLRSGSSPVVYTLNVPVAEGTLVLPNVVQAVFGLNSVVAGLQVRCARKVAVGARVRNQNSLGQTLGQSFVGFGSWGRLTVAVPVHIIGAAQNTGSRTNLWMVNLGAESVTVQIRALTSAGMLVGMRNEDMAPQSFKQVAQVLTAMGVTDVTNAVLALSLTAGTGPVACGGSTVDNATNDAATLVAMPAAGSTETLVMPAVRDTFSGAFLRTDLHVMNPGTSPAPVQVELSLTDGATAVQSVMVPPGSSVLWSDVLTSLFGRSAGTGVVRVASTSPILAQARLWATGTLGTFHEAIPGLPASLTAGRVLRGATWPELPLAEVQILATGVAAATGSVAFTPPVTPLPGGSILSPFNLGAAGGTVAHVGLPPLLYGTAMGEHVVESAAPVQAFSLQVSTTTGDPVVVPLAVSGVPRPVIVASPAAGGVMLDAHPRWAGSGWSWFEDGVELPGHTEQLLVTTGKTYHVVAAAPPFVAAGRSRPVVASFPLTVSRGGSGAGTVTSDSGGIDCGATCAAQFAYDSVVTLTAAPATGSAFTGWSGEGCSGTGTCQVTMDAARSVTATFDLKPAPTITSADHATFTVGTSGSFTVTAMGIPPPSLSASGALPAGVTFTDHGDGTATLGGTPETGTGGVWPLTLTAHNDAGADAVQSFTLTVQQAAAITSAGHATFTVGVAGSFTVTATGVPAPTLAASGTLPSGVTWTAHGDGTATLAGTPEATTGDYPLDLTAHNGVGSDAVQAFTLTVTVPGDADGDGAVDVQDVFHMINGLFAGGPAPVGSGDANGDGAADVLDIFYLVNYLFAGGPPPV